MEDQANNPIRAEDIHQLYHALIDLRQETRRLENEEITRELHHKFEELAGIINAIIDYNEKNKMAFFVKPVEGNEVEVAYIFNTGIAVDIDGNESMTLNDIYEKFFNDPRFIKVVIGYLAREVSEILDLIKRNADIYVKIAELDGKIDQLYQDVKKLCPQQDP